MECSAEALFDSATTPLQLCCRGHLCAEMSNAGLTKPSTWFSLTHHSCKKPESCVLLLHPPDASVTEGTDSGSNATGLSPPDTALKASLEVMNDFRNIVFEKGTAARRLTAAAGEQALDAAAGANARTGADGGVIPFRNELPKVLDDLKRRLAITGLVYGTCGSRRGRDRTQPF